MGSLFDNFARKVITIIQNIFQGKYSIFFVERALQAKLDKGTRGEVKFPFRPLTGG